MFMLYNVLKYDFLKSQLLLYCRNGEAYLPTRVPLVLASLCASWDVIIHYNKRALAEPLSHSRA